MDRSVLKKLLREPLIHFLALGAGLFVLFGILGAPSSGGDKRIVVTPGDVQRLEEAWTRQWQRPPTPAELEGLIQSHIREEILYREAMALGLDRDDTIIRRRLAQKMEFLSEDLLLESDPTDAELQAFLEQNPERFEIPPRLTFSHVYLNADQRGEATRSDAERLLVELRAAGTKANPEQLGDRFMLQHHYSERTQLDVAQLFGSQFAAGIFALEPGEWRGPVQSGYGVHLVLVHERTAPRRPELAEVRERVSTELSTVRREEANRAFFDRLLERYTVVIEKPAAPANPAGDP